MLSINLLPKPAQADLRAILLRRTLLIMGLSSFGVLALAATSLGLMRLSLTAQLGQTDAALQDVFRSPGVKLVLTADNAASHFNTLLNRIQGLESAAIRWSNIVRAVADATPSGIRLSSLTIDTTKSQVTVRGIGTTRAAVLAYQDALSADSRLANIESPLTNLLTDTAVNFSFTIALHTPTTP